MKCIIFVLLFLIFNIMTKEEKIRRRKSYQRLKSFYDKTNNASYETMLRETFTLLSQFSAFGSATAEIYAREAFELLIQDIKNDQESKK